MWSYNHYGRQCDPWIQLLEAASILRSTNFIIMWYRGSFYQLEYCLIATSLYQWRDFLRGTRPFFINNKLIHLASHSANRRNHSMKKIEQPIQSYHYTFRFWALGVKVNWNLGQGMSHNPRSAMSSELLSLSASWGFIVLGKSYRFFPLHSFQ